MTTFYALEIEDLKKTYASRIEALKGINLKVKEGDFFALLGANGAGKSTTIGLITSLLKKTSGTIQIQGFDLDEEPAAAKASLGLVPQEINLNIFETSLQILINQAGFYGIPRALALECASRRLKQLGLWDKRNTIVRNLSGGMKRRLMIARSLVHDPKVLILDEPTAGVDIEIRRSIWKFLTEINEEGTTIILTTHYLEEAEQLCKSVAIIDKGEIVIDTPMKTLLNSLKHQTFVFNTVHPIENMPVSPLFESKIVDSNVFELRMSNKIDLNQIFQVLEAHQIKILTMRNKTNRLEELFMDLISHDN